MLGKIRGALQRRHAAAEAPLLPILCTNSTSAPAGDSPGFDYWLAPQIHMVPSDDGFPVVVVGGRLRG